MPMKRDYTMLKVDSFKFNIALANAELEPKTLSKKIRCCYKYCICGT